MSGDVLSMDEVVEAIDAVTTVDRRREYAVATSEGRMDSLDYYRSAAQARVGCGDIDTHWEDACEFVAWRDLPDAGAE